MVDLQPTSSFFWGQVSKLLSENLAQWTHSNFTYELATMIEVKCSSFTTTPMVDGLSLSLSENAKDYK
jgi:hypothetical protein